PPRRGAPGWLGPATGVAVVIAAAAGSWWMVNPGQDAPQLADSSNDSSTAGLEFLAQPAPETSPAQIVVADHALTRDATPQVVDQATAPPPAEQPASTAPRVVQAPEPPLPPPGTAELRFEFSEDCWLEVTDADDGRLAYRLYRAGDVARLRGKAPLQVFLGNAEGVRLTVNGAPIAVRPAARRDGTARLTVGGGAG
ncbi:MAG TPA: DUF4115 domain-containing protein, partial [Gammaproteobacteria bacterium]|nr:DUF4115 domain-containing protein [Gammaproteobacteria bacterium]